ncbi:transcription factor bHLH30-like isoform X2 [Telopea speciosissima]|uniref:transcription factor bHLH30-like isoform X2 n=1 Tax=Telopea speciosissima TaxID=54955 RepID=UPI001CC41174|nr:transcription factor bHLH30-like isoform X2 [Telopea speciosissima]
MYAKKEEDRGEGSQGFNIHNYQEQLLLRQQQQQQFISDGYGGGSRGGLVFPDVSPIFQWSLPPVHTFNPVSISTNSVRDHDSFFSPPPPPPPSSFGGLFNRRASTHQFAYEVPSSDNLRILSDPHGSPVSLHQTSSEFGFQAEFGKMTAQEIIDAKALAASKSHSEAERRRRERINNHLAKLRSLLPNTTKTDKASLLAEVIQHVKELKRQTSQIEEASPVPTEIDELSVDASEEEGKLIIKASLCCEDRPDLLPDLIKTLKALKLRTLKAEITTLGGRVKNVLFITGDDDSNNNKQQHYSISSIKEGLKAVMERTTGDDSSAGSMKRQRTNVSILEHRSL